MIVELLKSFLRAPLFAKLAEGTWPARILKEIVMIECIDISYRYPGAETYVFQNLSLCIPEPGFNALFGPSGVGKTSLARIITGALTTCTGQVTYNGLNTILYSYNLERLPGWSSIGDHLDKIISPSQKHRLDDIIDVFGLEECMNSRFPQLSMGQKNRINFARYLLQDFDVLIMDEILANVDEPTRERIILNVKEMFPDKHFLYISHNAIEIAKYGKQILILRDIKKTPQIKSVEGLDFREGQDLDSKKLEIILLEIMNAA